MLCRGTDVGRIYQFDVAAALQVVKDMFVGSHVCVLDVVGSVVDIINHPGVAAAWQAVAIVVGLNVYVVVVVGPDVDMITHPAIVPTLQA